jgi:hypothetical protein
LLAYISPKGAWVNIGNACCPNCARSMEVSRMVCVECAISLEGRFELPALAALSPDDQVFVATFVRYHGSIKKMEELFGISYPTVKNRLNAIGAALDKSFTAPVSNEVVLEQLARGEISVNEAIERLR